MKTTLSICIASAVLVGCQTTAFKTHTASNPTTLNSQQASQSISLQELEDKRWDLFYAINPNGYVINLDKWHPNGDRSTFDFDKNPDKEAYRYMTDKDDLMSFNFGCNGFSTGFSLIDNKLVIDDAITQTLIGCGGTEDELRDALKGQNQLEYERKTNQLTITTHNRYRFILQGKHKPKEITPTLIDLSSYDWQLISAIQKPKNTTELPVVLLDMPLQQIEQRAKLNFDKNMMFYTVGCNQISRPFDITKDGAVTTRGITTTKMACGELAQAEQMINEVMAGSYRIQILKFEQDKANLYQTNADDTKLVWSGELKSTLR